VRDADRQPTMEVETFRAARDAIVSSTDLIVQFTSGGALTDSEEDRLAPLELRPEMASLTTGSVNFGTGVFLNPAPLIERFYRRMRDLGVLPEFEIFEPGHLANADRVYREQGDGHHRHFDFVLGVPGGMPAWPDALEFLEAHLPSGATWSATGIGRSFLDIAEQAVARGGHVRTGFEDVLYVGPGERAGSNRQLVEKVAGVARLRGRPLATPRDARSILGLDAERGTLEQ
jgi:3-keto-5-aminohexanoate cleavage enzyme